VSVKPVQVGREVERLSARRGDEIEARYRMLLEYTSDAVVVFEEGGRFLEVNERFCRLLGYGREELLRMNVLDLLPEEELARQPVSYEDLRAGKTVRRERRLLRGDGTRVRVEIVGSMVAEGTMQSVLRELPQEADELPAGGGVEFYEEVRRFESGLIRRALARTGGNQKAAAALLGVNHTTLHTMARRYGIDPSEFKPAPFPRLIPNPRPRRK
jgi:PAS domain S-box-containing protein